jgi:hypothetical protein
LDGLKAGLFGKINTVADEQRVKEKFEKEAAAAFVRSDPLGVYSKEEKEDDGPKRRESIQAAKPPPAVLGHFKPKRKKKEDDLFSSFGKEHDANGLQTVDGKMRVNYKRYWQSDSDLGRWQQSLADNSRHGSLLFDVRQRWNEDFGEDQAKLTQQHNALFRQRHAVEAREISNKKPSPAMEAVKDMKQKLTNPKTSKTLARMSGTSVDKKNVQSKLGLVEELTPFQFIRERPNRSYGEEQMLNLIGFLLTHYGNLPAAFRTLDENHSNALSFREFQAFLKCAGFRGDIQFLFYKLDLNADGVVDYQEFMNLRPYMLKEMVRLSIEAMEKRNRGDISERDNIWLKCAKEELNESGVLEQAQPVRPGSAESRTTFESAETPHSPTSTHAVEQKITRQISSGTQTGTMRGAFPRPEEPAEGGELVERLTTTRSSSTSQIRRLPRTISLFVFRNADKSNSGEAVFIKRFPPTMGELVQLCGEAIKPLVGPAECLLDTELRMVRKLEQVEKGGTYLLKGKEALDPPPHFFVKRHLPETSFRCLTEAQLAAHAEANSRPCTSSVRPSTTPPQVSTSLQGSIEGGAGRVGSPPQMSIAPPPSEHSRAVVPWMYERWEADSRLKNHLTCGGKNLPPTHRRYDLWTVLPRSLSEPFLGQRQHGEKVTRLRVAEEAILKVGV